MTALDKTALVTALTTLLVNNTTGDIEADELLARWVDALDSLLNSTGLADGEVPMKTAVDGVATASGIFKSGNNLMAPPDFLLESGLTQFNDHITLDQIGRFLAVTDRVLNAGGSDSQFALVDYPIRNGGVSSRPRIFERTEATTAFVLSSVVDTNITINPANPLTFNFVTTTNSQTNAFRFQVATSLVNARLRVSDTATGVALRYVPNQSAWISGEGGLDFAIGTQDFDFGTAQLITFANTDITCEVRATSGQLQGNTSNFPAVTFMLQRGQLVDMAYERDTQAQPFKKAARAVALTNITLSGLQTIDGVTLVAGDRVLLTGQTDASENGLYTADASTWTRTTDADTDAKVPSGIFVPVSEGTADADTLWYLTTNDPITLDTTDLTFREFSGTMTTFNAPAITAFSISGLFDFTPPVGTELGGTRTLTFTVSNVANVQGNLTFTWDGSPLSTSIDPAAGTVDVTIPSTVTAGGVTHTGVLSGTNTQGAAFNSTLTYRSANTGERAYYGALATDAFATVDVSTLTSVDVTTSGTVYSINISVPNGNIFGILSPANRDPVSIIDTVLNINSIGDFTATTSVRTIDSQIYNLLTITNNSGFTGTFNYTVTTE